MFSATLVSTDEFAGFGQKPWNIPCFPATGASVIFVCSCQIIKHLVLDLGLILVLILVFPKPKRLCLFAPVTLLKRLRLLSTQFLCDWGTTQPPTEEESESEPELRDQISPISLATKQHHINSSTEELQSPPALVLGGITPKDWSDDLIKKLPATGCDWEEKAPTEFDSIYRSRIDSGFGLKHIIGTPFILNDNADIIVALCKGGIYGFGTGFEYGYLISETIGGALRFMLRPGLKPKGPTRRGGAVYDVMAEDAFGDDFGEDSDWEYASDEYSDIHDSGIDECYSDSEDY